MLPLVGQLGAIGAEEFNAVIRKWVVAGADDHTQRRALRTGQVGDTGRWQGPEQHDIDAGRIEPAFQCAFKHIARNAGVLADQHGRPGLATL